MFKETALKSEKTALEVAVVVLQNRINEIDHLLEGGQPRSVADERAAPACSEHAASPARPQLKLAHNVLNLPTHPVYAEPKEEASPEAEQLSSAVAEDIGERFVAILNGVSTKRVKLLQKLLKEENFGIYNIKNGTKIYSVKDGNKLYLGKFTNTNARGLPLPGGKIQFLFATAEIASQYTS